MELDLGERGLFSEPEVGRLQWRMSEKPDRCGCDRLCSFNLSKPDGLAKHLGIAVLISKNVLGN